MDATKSAGIRFEQVFLRTAHFAHREDALLLAPNTPHPTDVGVLLAVNFYQGVRGPNAGVGVTVSTDPDDTRQLYQFQVEMIALVTVDPGQENMAPTEYVTGPALLSLIPFLREAIANLTMRGRFGPIWVSPVNIQQFLIERATQLRPELEAAMLNQRVASPRKRKAKKSKHRKRA